MNLPGPLEIGVIFLVALLIFGPKKLPEIGRTIGNGLRELKRMMNFSLYESEDKKQDDSEPDSGSRHENTET